LVLLRRIFQEIGLGLPQCGLERSRINLEQHASLAHLLAFPEIDFDDLPVDPRFHGDGRERLHVSNGLQADRDVLLHNRGNGDRHRRSVSSSALRALRLLCDAGWSEVYEDGTNKGCGAGDYGQGTAFRPPQGREGMVHGVHAAVCFSSWRQKMRAA